MAKSIIFCSDLAGTGLVKTLSASERLANEQAYPVVEFPSQIDACTFEFFLIFFERISSHTDNKIGSVVSTQLRNHLRTRHDGHRVVAKDAIVEGRMHDGTTVLSSSLATQEHFQCNSAVLCLVCDHFTIFGKTRDGLR